MKILCPIDFSVASVDAVRYAVALISKIADPHIELLHCIFPGLRSTIFTNYSDFLGDRVREDMDTLIGEFGQTNAHIKFSQVILRGNPLDLVPAHISKNEFDYTVIGTKGLNSVKEMIMGSLTERLFEKATCPTLAIPQAYVFHVMENVVLAVDDEMISSEAVTRPLVSIVKGHSSRLKLLHVRQKGDTKLEYDPELDAYLTEIPFDYYSKYTAGSVNKAINEVCQDTNADLLCLIHRHRGWMLNVFHRSQVREELFRMSMPILVLRD